VGLSVALWDAVAASGRMPVALWDAIAASGRMPVAFWVFHEKREKP